MPIHKLAAIFLIGFQITWSTAYGQTITMSNFERENEIVRFMNSSSDSLYIVEKIDEKERIINNTRKDSIYSHSTERYHPYSKYSPYKLNLKLAHLASNGFFYSTNITGKRLRILNEDGVLLTVFKKKELESVGIPSISWMNSSANALYIMTKEDKLFKVPIINNYDLEFEKKQEISKNKKYGWLMIAQDETVYKTIVTPIEKSGTQPTYEISIRKLGKSGEMTRVYSYISTSSNPLSNEMTFFNNGSVLIIPNYPNSYEEILYVNLATPDKVYTSFQVDEIKKLGLTRNCALVSGNRIVCPYKSEIPLIYKNGYKYGFIRFTLTDDLDFEELHEQIKERLKGSQFKKALSYINYTIKKYPDIRELHYYRVLSKIGGNSSIITEGLKKDNLRARVKRYFNSRFIDIYEGDVFFKSFAEEKARSNLPKVVQEYVKDLELALLGDYNYNSDIKRILGYIYYYSFNFKKAIPYFREVLMSSEGDEEMHEFLIASYIYNEDFGRAKSALSKAIYLFPDNTTLDFFNGSISFIEGNYAQAINHYKNVDNWLMTAAAHNAGMAYVNLNDIKSACNNFRYAFDRGGTDSHYFLYQNCNEVGINLSCDKCGGNGNYRPEGAYHYRDCDKCNGNGNYWVEPEREELEMVYFRDNY